MAKKETPHRSLMNAAFDQAAKTPWRRMTMASIAKHAGIPLNDALVLFPHKNAILDGAIADVTTQALAECPSFTDEETTRDRLFALLMARFDAMTPYRSGVKNIARGILSDPVALMCRVPPAMAAMAHMLEAAGVDSSGLEGVLKTKGLMMVFARTVRVWLNDETDDMAQTMAALDQNLGRADTIARQLFGKTTPEQPTET